MGRSTASRWVLRIAVGMAVALLAFAIFPAAWAADLGSATEPPETTTQSVTDPVDDTAEAVEETVDDTAEAVEETVAETTEPVTGTVEETVSGEDSEETSPSTGTSSTDSSADKSASGVSTESETAGGSGQQETTSGGEETASTAPPGEGSATSGAGGGSPDAGRSGTAPRADAGVPSSPGRAERESSTPAVPAALGHEMATTSSVALQADSFGGPADLFRSVARSGQGLTGDGNPVLGVSGDQFSAALVFVLLALALVAAGKGALRLDTAKPA